MKSILYATICLVSLCVFAFADDLPYQLEYTVTYKDGSKTEGSAPFLADESIDIPIHMDTLGICVLTFTPQSLKNQNDSSSQLSGFFEISPLSTPDSANVKNIFRSRLPFASGKAIALLKAFDLSVSVKITAPEKKE